MTPTGVPPGTDPQPFNTLRTTIIALLLLLLGGVGCMVVSVVALDQVCRADIDHWLPLYPGAHEVEAYYEGLRPRALGHSYMVFSTPDTLYTVRLWYLQHRQTLVAPRYTGTDPHAPLSGLARLNYYVQPDTTGSRIYMVTTCGLPEVLQATK